jgi:hypothetical protein
MVASRLRRPTIRATGRSEKAANWKSRELAEGGVGVKRTKIIKRDGLLKLGGATPFIECLYNCQDVRGSVSRVVLRMPIPIAERPCLGGGLWDIRY